MTLTIATAPGLVVGLTVCAYWLHVAGLVLRTAAGAGGLRGLLVPAQPRERGMLLLWFPLIVAWVTLPLIAGLHRPGTDLWGVPAWAAAPLAVAGRWLAAALALACLALSRVCWRHMGRHWRMAVDPQSPAPLLREGPFAVVRHPIYALSILLALCTLAAAPTPPLAVVIAIHILLMHGKARNEERHLHERHGAHYAEYCAAVGRFLPRRLDALRQWHLPAPAPSSPAPSGQVLGPFQRTMLLFEELHPYNAVHAVRIARPADPAQLEAAIAGALSAAGIGTLAVARAAGALRYEGTCPVCLRVLPPADEPAAALRALIDHEMNAPFPDMAAAPVRWTMLEEPGGAAHWIVLAYRHLVADAAAATALLGSVLGTYLCGAAPLQLTPSPPPEAAEFMAAPSGWARFAQFVRTVILYFRLRYAHRMPDEKLGGDRTHVLLAPATPALPDRLASAARRKGAGLNDAFLAALAAAIAAHTPDRRVSRHRRRVVLASALSGRRLCRADLRRYFGVVLGDLLIDLPRPDAPLPALLNEIARQTRRRKRAWRAAVALAVARRDAVTRVWPLFSVPHNRRSYRKLFPICGGVSTVAIERAALGPAAALVTRYIRACPPGPAMPLVLAPTLWDGRLELTLVVRDACIPPGDQGLIEDVIAALCELAGLRPESRNAPATGQVEHV